VKRLALPVVALLAGCSSDFDWAAYLGDPSSSHYSRLQQIDTANVRELRVAWIHRTGDADPENRSQIQCNPIVVDGVLYGTSPRLALFALDAATGEELWRFDPFSGEYRLFGIGVNRGVVYWKEGSDERILYTAGEKLYAVDARTGKTIPSFGEGGAVDLHEGLGERAQELFVSANTPGVVFEDLLILGHRASESLPSVPGDIRAFDVRSGKLVWSFHTIPHPGEYGHDTWPEDSWKRSGGANAWAGMSLDVRRGVVYVPTGSAAYDFYGGDRPGANLFANTLLALDARTGRRLWHYQAVHHDLWDRDLPAPPNLVTIEREGRKVDAVAQITKSGHVFVFDRDTGEPLFPIEEREALASGLEGEATWPTQPVPVKPPPFARSRLTKENALEWAHARLERLRPSEPFTPPSREGTIIFPGFDGGGEWGGAAHDPETGILYVNASEMPWVLTMVDVHEGAVHSGRMVYATHCAYCHGIEREGDSLGAFPSITDLDDETHVRDLLREGQGFMPSFAHLGSEDVDSLLAYLFDRADPRPAVDEEETLLRYTSTGYHRFVDQGGNPAVEPPWGTLTAIDLNQGEILWQATLGSGGGTENYGGPLVTAGGLVFIAATKDEKIRAFDRGSGALLWEADLPAGGYATPATYSVDGHQYVVVAAGGGKMGTKSGDAYVAFALPDRRRPPS
jgi:quinoprotein glucose dehydrogenase